MRRTTLCCVLGSAVIAMTGAAFATGPQNAQEQQIVAQLKAAYQKQGLTLTPEREEETLQRYRGMQQMAIEAQVLNDATPNASPIQQLANVNAMLRQAQGQPPTPAPAAAPAPAPTTPPAQALVAQAPMASAPQASTMPAPMAPPAPASTPGAGASQLASAIAERRAAAAPAVFTPKADGFTADGKPFVDPQGRVETFGGNGTTGDVVWFAQQAPDRLVVRYTNVHSQLAPITVGTVELEGGMMRFTSVDGQQAIAGDNVIPTGDGIVVARTGTVFRYPFGQALANQPLPEGYFLAPYQQGDVAGTGYVLLRRDISKAEKQDVVKGITSIFKSLTNHNTDSDYALFNVRNGHVVYLNIGEYSETVSKGVNCRPKNAFINKCTGWKTYEALYDSSGIPNYGHYFWRVDWRPTAAGATAVVIENGVSELNVIRLDSGTRANAFHRGLGIQKFAVQPTAAGSLKVTASWAFKDHVVEDVQSLFAQAAPTGAGAAAAPDAAAPMDD